MSHKEKPSSIQETGLLIFRASADAQKNGTKSAYELFAWQQAYAWQLSCELAFWQPAYAWQLSCELASW